MNSSLPEARHALEEAVARTLNSRDSTDVPTGSKYRHDGGEHSKRSANGRHERHGSSSSKREAASSPKSTGSTHSPTSPSRRAAADASPIFPAAPSAADTPETLSGGEGALLEMDRKLAELALWLSPSRRECEVKMQVLRDVREALRRAGFTADIYGSLNTGLMTPVSDIDCVVMPLSRSKCDGLHDTYALRVMREVLEGSSAMSPRDVKHNVGIGIRAIGGAMRQARNFKEIRVIAHARVPIVKCKHRDVRLPIDLSFERDGCNTSYYLCEQFRLPGNELARALIILVKALVATERLDDPSVGGLGSFPISLMVLWYLQQVVPTRFQGALRRSLSSLFVGFLRYYSHNFDFRRLGIDVARGETVQKGPSSELLVRNPLKPMSNCAAAASLFSSRVVPLFSKTAAELQQLLSSSVSASKVEAGIFNVFCEVAPECGDWPTLRQRLCQSRVLAAQHMWDPKTNLYIGGVLPENYITL